MWSCFFCAPPSSHDTVHDVTGMPVRAVTTASSDVGTKVNMSPVITDDNLLIKPFMDTLPDCITDHQRGQVQALLLKYVDIYSRFDYDVGQVKGGYECELKLAVPSLPPVSDPLRKHPYAYLQEIDNQVAKLLDAGLITQSTSAW